MVSLCRYWEMNLLFIRLYEIILLELKNSIFNILN